MAKRVDRDAAERRGVVRELLQSWSPGDLATFSSLLAAFNAGLDHHLSPDPHTPSPTAEESQP